MVTIRKKTEQTAPAEERKDTQSGKRTSGRVTITQRADPLNQPAADSSLFTGEPVSGRPHGAAPTGTGDGKGTVTVGQRRSFSGGRASVDGTVTGAGYGGYFGQKALVDDVQSRLQALQAEKSGLEAGLDLDGAAALQPEIDRLSRLAGYAGKRYQDDFAGQFMASMGAGRFGQEEGAAWNQYLNDPTPETRAKAEETSQLRTLFQRQNAQALDDDATLPWLSQSAAGYLPQFWDQTKARVGGGLAGSVLTGLATGGAGIRLGWNAGSATASAVQMYGQIKGAAFRGLLDIGVDETLARSAVEDEALLNAAIEFGDTLLDNALLGTNKLLDVITKGAFGGLVKNGAEGVARSAARRFLAALAKYGINVAGEGTEELLQEGVSIANEDRTQRGEDTGLFGLAREAGGVIWDDAIQGNNEENRTRMWTAAGEGAKIAAMFGGAQMAGNYGVAAALGRSGGQQDATGRADQAIDTAYGAMMEHGMFSQEARQSMDQASDALQVAAEQVVREGRVSNRTAERVMADGQAVETLAREVGLELTDDMSMSQRRAAVKNAVEALARGEEGVSDVAVEADTGADNAAQTQQQTPQPVAQRVYNRKAVAQAASVLGQQGARVAQEFYNDDLDPAAYYGSFSAYYQAGLTGADVGKVQTMYADALNDAQKQAAYLAGQTDAAASLAAERGRVDSAVLHQNETTYVENAEIAHLTQKQATALNHLGRALGVKIQFVPELEYGGDGAYYDTDGTIRIAANAQSPVLLVAAHEITHRLQDLAPDKYRLYRDYANRKISEQIGRDAVEEIRERYARSTDGRVNLTTEQAMDEVAAEFTEALVRDGKLFADLAQENRSVAQKVLDAIRDFIAKVKGVFGKDRQAQDSAAMEQYGVDMQTLEEAARLWNEALKAAQGQTRQMEGQKNTAREGGVVKYSLDGYDQRQLKNWKGSKHIIVYESEAQLRQFIRDARAGTLPGKKMYFGMISADLARRVMADTGLNVEGFNCSISAYEVQKIFKDHGNEAKESLRGQRAITEDDIVSIPEIITSPDKIRLSPTQYNGKPVIDFVKTINGKTTVTSYISSKHLDLTVQTMFSGKKSGNLSTPMSDQALINTPEASGGTVSNSSVSQDGGDVNAKFSLKSPIEETRNLLALHNLTERNLRDALSLGGMPMPSIAIVRAQQGHAKYGPISLVFSKDTIDPRADRRNRVYGGDAWTPTAPSIQYEPNSKAEQRIHDKYYELARRIGYDAARPLYNYATDLEDTLNRNGGEQGIMEKLRDDTRMMNLFLADSGKSMVENVQKETVTRLDDETIRLYDYLIDRLGEDVINEMSTVGGEMPMAARRRWMEAHGDELEAAYRDYLQADGIGNDAGVNRSALAREVSGARSYLVNGPETRRTDFDSEATEKAIRDAVDQDAYDAWLRETFGGIEGRRGIYNGRDPFTSSGNRRSWSSLHHSYTLENIVQAMADAQEERGQGTWGVGATSLQAVAAPRYGSVQEIRDDSGRLGSVEGDAYSAAVEAVDQQISAIIEKVRSTNKARSDNSFIETDNIAEALKEAAGGRKTVDTIMRTFADSGYKISSQTAQDIQAVYRAAAELPTEYFEAKPRRAVGFEEVLAAVVPDDMDAALRSDVEQAGMNVLEYKSGDDADRLAKVNSVEGARFSIKGDNQDPVGLEERLNALRTEMDGVTSQLEDPFGELDAGTRKRLNNRLAKLQHDIDTLVAQERRAAVRTPLRTIRDNLSNYRRSDLDSLAEQISNGSWDGYEDLSRADLEAALADALDENMAEMNPLETQAARYGLFVRPVGRASALQGIQGDGTIGATRYSMRDSLTEDETDAILRYKSSESYKINAKLRDGIALTESEQHMVELLDGVLAKLPRYEGVAYRNLTFLNRAAMNAFVSEHAEGNIAFYKSFISVSKVADGYPVDGAYVVHLIIQKSTGGRDVSGFGNNFESEVVYPRLARFIPERISYDADGTPTIYLKEDINYVAREHGQLHSKERSNPVLAVSESSSGDLQLQGVSERDPGEVSGRGRALQGQDSDGVEGSRYSLREKSRMRAADVRALQEEVELLLEEASRTGRSEAEVQADIRELVQEAYQGQLARYGAIPRGERPAREVEVPRRTAEDRKVSQTVRTILEAGATPEEAIPTIQELTARGQFSYEVATDKEAIAQAEERIRDKGYAAALADWSEAVGKGQVSKGNTALGWALYDQAANAGDMKTAMTVLTKMVGHQRSAAQAVQATRILKQMPADAQLYGVQRSVENLKEELEGRYGKQAPDIRVDEGLARKLLEAKDQKARDEAMKELYRDIGRQMPSRFADKWNAWRYLAMLGNPRTHVRNIVGNAGFVPVVAAKNMTATAIEAAVSRVSRGRLERTKGTVGLGKRDRALLAAAWGDYGSVEDQALGGGKYSDFANANQYIEEGRTIFRTRALERARKANSKALDKEDVWFSRPHYAYALAQYCKANHITQEQLQAGTGLEKARAYAVREAQKATYRDTNAFSQMVSELGRYRGGNRAKKGLSVVLEGILPFRKTPANILVRGLEYSPMGLLKGLTYDLAQVGRGELTGAEAIDHISAGLTGTGLVGLGVYLAAQGLVRGAGGDDEDKKEFEQLQGHQAYALELPGGTSVTLDWLAPEALPFFVGVNLWEQTQGEGEPVTMAELLTATKNVTEPLLEMSCLQSLNDVFDAVGYAASDGLDGLPAALASASTSYLTQGFPTILGQLERTGQGERMTTYTEKNAFLTGDMQYTLGRISGRLPGWDYNQIPYIDAWGRTEDTGSVAARAGGNFLNPAYTSTVETSAMEEELLRLYEATGDAGVLPGRAAKYFTVDGARKDLTAQEYVDYAREKGQTAQRLLEELTAGSAYQAMSDTEKAQAVDKIYEYANAAAKATVSDYAPEGWVAKAIQTEQETGLAAERYVPLYLAQKGVESLRDQDGETIPNSKGLLIMEMVYDVPGLTDKQRKALFEDFGVGKSVAHYNKTLVRDKLREMRRQSR